MNTKKKRKNSRKLFLLILVTISTQGSLLFACIDYNTHAEKSVIITTGSRETGQTVIFLHSEKTPKQLTLPPGTEVTTLTLSTDENLACICIQEDEKDAYICLWNLLTGESDKIGLPKMDGLFSCEFAHANTVVYVVSSFPAALHTLDIKSKGLKKQDLSFVSGGVLIAKSIGDKQFIASNHKGLHLLDLEKSTSKLLQEDVFPLPIISPDKKTCLVVTTNIACFAEIRQVENWKLLDKFRFRGRLNPMKDRIPPMPTFTTNQENILFPVTTRDYFLYNLKTGERSDNRVLSIPKNTSVSLAICRNERIMVWAESFEKKTKYHQFEEQAKNGVSGKRSERKMEKGKRSERKMEKGKRGHPSKK